MLYANAKYTRIMVRSLFRKERRQNEDMESKHEVPWHTEKAIHLKIYSYNKMNTWNRNTLFFWEIKKMTKFFIFFSNFNYYE